MLSHTKASASTVDQALNKAIDKALGTYSSRIIPMINWEIIGISGQSGGAAGAHCDVVSIEIQHKLTREYLEAQAFELEEELAA